MKLIGLTGSIATGKSTVAKMFKEFGFYIIDADEIAHSVYKKGERAYFDIIKAFGKEMLDKSQEIDRKKLGNLVLNDKKKLSILESIVHPAVENKRLEILEQIKKRDPDACIIHDIPLLFEKKLQPLFNCVVVVYVPLKIQVKRLMNRENITEKEALKKISLQLSIEEKKRLADIVIDNSKTVIETRKQVKNIAKKIKSEELC